MTKKDLIPIRTKAEAKRLGRKGGLVRSPRKKYASRLRELKKKGLTCEGYKKLVDIMEEPESSILDIKLFLDTIKGDPIYKNKKIELANAYIKLHQSHHGTKHEIKAEIKERIESVTINIIEPSEEKKE